MGAIANLSASLEWDIDDFQRGTSKIEGAFKGIIGLAGTVADAVANAGKRMTVGLSIPLAGIAILTGNAAASADELQSAFDYTFGAMSKRMSRWAEDTGDSMGRATQEMQEGALKFGQLFKAAAPNEAVAARLSQRFTELAQDASSFFDTDFDTAMGKIRSGLSGEAEPLRDFGVFLTETAVKAKAVELGLIKSGQELDEYGKIMARAALIAEGLVDAQGDIERTSDSLSNRIRKIKGDIRELAVEIGEILEPYAQKLASIVEVLVQKFKDLPDGVKRAIVGFGIFLAALGPLSIALSALAVTVLPLVLVKMGPLFAIISAIVNPIGTAVVFAGKLIAEFGGLAAIVSKLAPILLRFLGPIGLVVSIFQLFGDDILRGLQSFWRFVSNAFGSGLQGLFASLADTVRRVSEAFDVFMETDLGKFISDAVGFIGMLLEALITLAGFLTGQLISAFFETFAFIADIVGGAIEIVVKLLTGDWAGAWDAAMQTVGRAVIRIGRWIQELWPWLGGLLQMLGKLTGAEISEPKAPGNAPGGGGGKGPAGGDMQGRDYSLASDAKPKKGRSARGRTGPTAEELADRREEIKLEQQLAVAREANDHEAIRSLERQRDLREKIERYERAGLNRADARIAAERDLVELDEARRSALQKFLAERQVETEYQIAVLSRDYEHLRYLDDELELERRINDLNREGYDLAVAEKIARGEMLAIENARAGAAARRLKEETLAHELELARLRGDNDDDIRRREENLRRVDRVDYLMDRGGMSRAEAEAQALREAADRSRAHLQGTFRDAFRNGLQAAMDGNLGDFFEGWMRERSFNALSRVLDSLADGIASLFSGQSGGGGLFGAVLGAFGVGGGSSGAPANLLEGTPHATPGFNTGGSFKVSGYPGIDKNLLSLNGNPIARVSSGEIMDIRRGEPQSGSAGSLEIRLGPGLEAEWLSKSAGQTVQILEAVGPGMAAGASAKARQDAARPVMPGGATG